MNANLLPEPERWSERPAGTAAEDAIGGSLRRIKAATEPSASAAPRWAQHAMAPAPRPSAPTRVWSIAAVAAILGGASVVAASVAWRAVRERTPAAAPGYEPSKAPRKHRATVARQETLPAAVETPAPAAVEMPAPAVVETPPPAAVEKALPAAVETPPAAATHFSEPPHAMPIAPAPVPSMRAEPKSLHWPTAPAPRASVTPVFEPAPLPAGASSRASAQAAPDEALLLARAFRRLRNEGDARGALQALDERERRFGAGALA